MTTLNPLPKRGRTHRAGPASRSLCEGARSRSTYLVAAALLALTLTRAVGQTALPMLGFTAESAAKERSLEQRFDAQLNPADLRSWLKTMSAEPNQVGSPHDKANADFMLKLFSSWGWDTHLETFYVLYPTPTDTRLELVSPGHFTAKLHEGPVAGDKSAGAAGSLPPYNVFGADGEVTGGLVYVNTGMPDDYLVLERRGISVKGKIVIARYGGGWRGLKPKLAYEHGAIGCLIYSDPKDDGYGRGDVYPKGGNRPADGVQRGSVQDMTLYSGDPLTPGVGATKDAKRLSIADATTILKIPVIPISYGDAQPLLAALEGPVAPEAWRGGLPITYHLGPGPAKVHLRIKSEWSLKPIYDVVAKMRGSEYPDEWIVRGNHHDGWVFGTWDPLAGNIVVMEEAKAIGALAKSGWRPKRTLVYTNWDAEEPGLLGSTEWVETHADELQKKAILYINSDENARGFLQSGGSHGLERFVNQVADEVKDPETGVSVGMRAKAREAVLQYERGTPERKPKQNGLKVSLGALGSGSDFTPFLQHIGIATLSFGYSGEDDDSGIYHSAYDTFDHYIRFGDPTFAYGVTLAQTVGRVVLRTADSDLPTYHFEEFADHIATYVSELRELTTSMRTRDETLANLIQDGSFHLAADPTHPVGAPAVESAVPHLDFTALDQAVKALKKSAAAYDRAAAQATGAATPFDAAVGHALDQALGSIEQTLLDPTGLPRREWYRHLIYAPGQHTGYGVKTLPGVREAIELRQWDEAQAFVPRTAAVLNAYAARIDQATLAFHSAAGAP